jgi:flavodoxin
MINIIVIYDTKYGNTKLVAEKIIEAINQTNKITTEITDIKDVKIDNIINFDAIVIGTPNHWGGPVRGVKKLIDKLGKVDLKAKGIAVFDTYIKKDFEKAVKKMEKRIIEKIPNLKIITPGLSIKVDDMKGPVTKGEFPKAKEFGKKIATQLKN